MPDDTRPSQGKIAALLLIAVVAAGIGLYSYAKESPAAGGALGSVLDRLSLTGLMLYLGDSGKPIAIDGALSFDVPPEIALNLKDPASEFSVSLSGENSFTLDRVLWQFQDGTSIGMKNYTGKVTLAKEVSVAGSAKSIRINLASESVSEKGIPVQASGVKSSSVVLAGINSASFDLKNITGTIKADDGKNSATYAVTNNMLSVSGFSGSLEFYGNRIILRGTGRINADLLKQGG